MDINQYIEKHSLYIDEEYEPFINNFCSTTGNVFPQGKLGNYLGSWYEGYLYCLLIGLNTNSRHYDGFVKRHQKMPTWSRNNLNQYKFCISRVISRDDIVFELGIADRKGINEKFESSEKLLLDLKDICDEFSLGGVRYLKNLFDNNPNLFSNDAFALKNIYERTLLPIV
jgi:hypothetical protein